MRVLMFKDRFASLVESGEKTRTIRKHARCKPGDTLSLRQWTGRPYRSKQRVLRTAICRNVVPVLIVPGTSGAAFEDLAKADGFSSFAEMKRWFAEVHGLPFEGEMIVWEGL